MKSLLIPKNGRDRLLPILRKHVPSEYGTYYEPFFRDGSLCMDLDPKAAVVNAENRSLMGLYEDAKRFPMNLVRILSHFENEYNSLQTMDEKEKYYLFWQNEYNKFLADPEPAIEESAILVLMNRTCVDGMHGLNLDGRHDAPFGRKERVKLCVRENVFEVSELLQRTRILCEDFEASVSDAKAGDFVFFDPPRQIMPGLWEDRNFRRSDQNRLDSLFGRLTDKGVLCMMLIDGAMLSDPSYGKHHIERIDVSDHVLYDPFGAFGTLFAVKNW